MWAVKRPIANLEQKPWPVYESEQLLSPDTRNTVFYLTRYKVNGKEYEH